MSLPEPAISTRRRFLRLLGVGAGAGAVGFILGTKIVQAPPSTELVLTNDFITFKGLTADPIINDGRMWYRSDIDQIRGSPDGIGFVNMSHVAFVQADHDGLPNPHHAENHRARHISGGADAFLSTDVLEAIVKRLQESAGPTTLTLGAIVDGEFLKRVGATIVSAASAPTGAPTDAEYVVGAFHAGLSAERLVTNTPTVAWDLGTIGQAKADVPNNAITDLKLRDSAAVSVIGRAAETIGDPADIPLTINTVLGRRGGGLLSDQVITAQIGDAQITNTKLRDSAGFSVIGKSNIGSGSPFDIVAGADGQFFRRMASALSFTTIEISRGGTLFKSDGIIAAVNIIVWRAPFACTVTNVRGYRVGGTGATINARLNGISNHLATALSLTTADAWADGGAVQNTAYVAGDKMEIMIVTVAGSPTQIAIQIDLTRQ